MDWRNAYRTALTLLALVSLAGGLWLVVSPGPSPGVEITRPAPTATALAAAESGGADSAAVETEQTGLIDLNTATASELTALPGIGEVLAERIVEHRNANGPFARLDQLMAVRGIGPVTYERVRALVRLGK